MEKALINKLIPFSNVDGPGNRFAIFFQGCPFKCLYCHNPETINLCINCGKCINVCPTGALSNQKGKVVWDKRQCISCDNCLKACQNLASPKVKEYSVREIIEEIKKVKSFIRGITVSGGECTNYEAFLVELFTEVKKIGLSILIDSNGANDFSKMLKLLALSDGVMLDVKAYDDGYHQYLTGRSNKMVLKNLHYLLKNNKLFEVRTVILPGIDNSITVNEVCKIIKDNVPYKLIKYRPFGVREDGLNVFGKNKLTDDLFDEIVQIAQKYNANIITK